MGRFDRKMHLQGLKIDWKFKRKIGMLKLSLASLEANFSVTKTPQGTLEASLLNHAKIDNYEKMTMAKFSRFSDIFGSFL